jgi:hypothetical protein
MFRFFRLSTSDSLRLCFSASSLVGISVADFFVTCHYISLETNSKHERPPAKLYTLHYCAIPSNQIRHYTTPQINLCTNQPTKQKTERTLARTNPSDRKKGENMTGEAILRNSSRTESNRMEPTSRVETYLALWLLQEASSLSRPVL